MAREARIVEGYGANNNGEIRRFTVADGTAISKGALLRLTDARTASAFPAGNTAASLAMNAGIAASEKEASDGQTSLGLVTQAIVDVSASGAITVGEPITFIIGNYVAKANASASGAAIAGYALETATDAEIINCRIDL